MRKLIFLAAALCGLFSFQSCDLDNYEGPSASLTGILVDSETNENVPCQYQNGARIRIYEFYKENWSTQPNDFYTKQDGTFTNNVVFPGKYKIEAQGAFETPETIEMEISGTANLEIKVVPFLRLTATATNAGDAVQMTANVKHTSSKRTIKAIEFYCGKTPYVDKNTYEKKVVVDLSKQTDEQITSSTFANKFVGLVKGKTYYFRVGALGQNSGNYYNYSTIIEVTI